MSSPTPESTALARAKDFSAMLWHVGTFIIINGFFWILDLTIGQEGAQWAYWITLFWGLALAFHVLYYYVTSAEARKTRKLIDLEDRDRTPQPQ